MSAASETLDAGSGLLGAEEEKTGPCTNIFPASADRSEWVP